MWNKNFSFILCVYSFKKEVVGKGGVKSYRFGPDEKAFADPEHEPENQCYCPSSINSGGNSSSSSSSTMPKMMSTAGQCAPHGTFNVSLCQYGIILDIFFIIFHYIFILDLIYNLKN